MRAAIIINPASGAHANRATMAESREERARQVVGATGVAVDIRVTTARGHAAQLSTEFAAAGVDRVIVWGGDGTVNEVAGPLVGTTVALGIIPGGSGDGLARSLELPRDPQAAIRFALTGQARSIDIGWLGGRHFVNVAGIGFDAEVAHRFDQRATRGLGGYLSEGLRAVWTYACADYEITAEGRRFTGPHFLIALANGSQYGNGLVVAPDANFSDGLLNLVLVSGGSPMRQLWRARRLGWRQLKPAEGVWRQQVRTAGVTGPDLHCHVDGETFQTSGTVDVRVSPGALKIIAGEE